MKMKGRVLVVISDDFSVNTDLRQVSVISSLLCIWLVEVIIIFSHTRSTIKNIKYIHTEMS